MISGGACGWGFVKEEKRLDLWEEDQAVVMEFEEIRAGAMAAHQWLERASTVRMVAVCGGGNRIFWLSGAD